MPWTLRLLRLSRYLKSEIRVLAFTRLKGLMRPLGEKPLLRLETTDIQRITATGIGIETQAFLISNWIPSGGGGLDSRFWSWRRRHEIALVLRQYLVQIANPSVVSKVERLARLAQLDRIPDRPDATDPLPWDERGLPV